MTVKMLLDEAQILLGADKRLEAQLLLAFVLGKNRASLLAHGDDEVTEDNANEYRQKIARLANGEPFQYILGTAEFMGMSLIVNAHVLIPRFDTEILVERALRLLAKYSAPKVLDICTGSGAIALSVAKYAANAAVWASDISADALQVARENCRRQKLAATFVQGDLFAPFEADYKGHFDVITANPPYITTAEMAVLPKDVRKEPRLALWGGDDGLDFYRRIIKDAENYLADNGYLLLEIGYAQGAAVKNLLQTAGYQSVEIIKDYQGHDRVISGEWVK